MFTILSLAVLSNTVQAESFRIFAAARVVDKVATNYDIMEYLETTRLSDSQMVKFFEQAGKDYNKYIQLRNQALKPQYETAIRQWTYFQMVEKDALKDRKTGKSPAFRITQDQFNKAINEIEDKAVKKYLDQRLGIVKARDLAGKDLRETGFPFKADESNTDTYFRWYELQKRRLMENFRMRESRRHEVFEATRGFEVHIRPTDMWDFGKKNQEIVNSKLNGKRMDKPSLLKFVSENPELRVTLESLDALSINDMSLANIAKINKSEAQNLANSISDVFANEEKKLMANIQKYLGISKQFSAKYSVEELKEKAKASREAYLRSNGEYTDLMLAKIYELAIEIKANNDEGQIQAHVSNLPERIKLLSNQINDESVYSDSNNALFMAPDLTVKLYRASLDNDSKLINALEDMVSATLKFEVIKIGISEKSLVSAKSCDIKTYECQKKINEHLKEKEIENGIKRFRENDLRYYEGMVQVNPTGNDNLYGGEALDWVLGRD